MGRQSLGHQPGLDISSNRSRQPPMQVDSPPNHIYVIMGFPGVG